MPLELKRGLLEQAVRLSLWTNPKEAATFVQARGHYEEEPK